MEAELGWLCEQALLSSRIHALDISSSILCFLLSLQMFFLFQLSQAFLCLQALTTAENSSKEQASVDTLHNYNTKVIVTLIPRRSNSVSQRLVMCLHQVTIKLTSVRMVASCITFHGNEWLLQELDNRIRASLPFLVTPIRMISIALFRICHRSEVRMICAGLKVPFILLLLISETSGSALVVLNILWRDKMQQTQFIITNMLEKEIDNVLGNALEQASGVTGKYAPRSRNTNSAD